LALPACYALYAFGLARGGEKDGKYSIMEKHVLTSKKILVVDDEQDIIAVIAELLPMCDIIAAASFEEGRKALENDKYDIVLLDIMGVDGYGLLKIAKSKNRIVVMLTAHSLSPQSVIKSHDEGAQFYIPKDKILNIETYLLDVLRADRRGESTWARWMHRFESYFNKRFGADWRNENKAFWDKIGFYI